MRSGLETLPLRNSGKSCNISGSGVLSGRSVMVCSTGSDSIRFLSSSCSIFFVSFEAFLRTPSGGPVDADTRRFSV